jgi:hypothetical protein
LYGITQFLRDILARFVPPDFCSLFLYLSRPALISFFAICRDLRNTYAWSVFQR